MASSSSPVSPASSADKLLWTSLSDRVDAILEHRKPGNPPCAVESERAKRLKEGTQLLLRGFDSVSSSLSQLTSTLSAAQKTVTDLAKPSLGKGFKRGNQDVEDEEQPKTKRHCGSDEIGEHEEMIDAEEKVEEDGFGGVREVSVDVRKSAHLKKAKSLAISMAGKAASLTKELKVIKSDLCFMQERCTFLEKENRRLREALGTGVRAEEDDLVRLQLEALLAEKSRLANENANLTRENQCLLQLVEYHQLTAQDLSASYEQAIHGLCLDFSSPLRHINDLEDSEAEAPYTSTTDQLEPGGLLFLCSTSTAAVATDQYSKELEASSTFL